MGFTATGARFDPKVWTAAFAPGAASPARFVPSSLAPVLAFAFGSAPFFDPSTATFSNPSGAHDMIAGSSIFQTSGAGTQFLGLGTASAEGAVQVAVPQGEAKRLLVARDTAPGVGCSITYVVRKNGASTGIYATLSDAETTASSNPMVTIAFLAGDLLSVEQVRTGSVAPGIDNFSVHFQLTT